MNRMLGAAALGDGLPARLGDLDVLAGQRARRGGAERDDEPGLDQVQFEIEPPAAMFDLVAVRLLVDAALAARLEFEMLHGIGDVDALAVDAGLGTAWSNIWPAGPTKGRPVRSS